MLHIVGGLPVNAFTAPTIESAWEVLMNHPIDVVFCDDQLPDGHYPDFLKSVRSEHRMAQFIVLLSSDDWEDCLEAMRLGASDVLRSSCQPTDLELVLMRAGREVGQRQEFHLPASA